MLEKSALPLAGETKINISFEEARELLLCLCQPVSWETVPLSEGRGRVLSQDLPARGDVPTFARSPYDGYAFRAADSRGASRRHPVRLRVLEEITAGGLPKHKIIPGAATKLLTGAPIPQGADAVIMYELTEFTADTVTIFAPASPGQDIVRPGEEAREGTMLARRGDLLDPALAGTLAAQGFSRLPVFRKAKAGILCTGNELVEVDQPLSGGRIRNSGRYALQAACEAAGLETVYLGQVQDNIKEISGLMELGLESCDILFTTGGVSVGDYDLTPAAMETLGARILVRGLSMKPGGACAYAQKGGKLIFGLSGNPAAAMTNFYALAQPFLRKLCGHGRFYPRAAKVTLLDGFNKASRHTRLLCGRLDLSGGVAGLRLPVAQGHALLRSLVGCDAIAIIPPASPPLAAGAVLEAYLLD